MTNSEDLDLSILPLKWHNAIHTLHSVEDFVQWATPILEQTDLYYGHGSENAEDEAAWIGSFIAEFIREDFVDSWDRLITVEQIYLGMQILSERVSNKTPIAYIIKEAWFAGYRFDIDERALIPRSHLGEWIPDLFTPWISEKQANNIHSILDLCCGGGCIGIATAQYLPEATLTLADLSKDALEVSKMNVERYKMSSRSKVVVSNLFDKVEGKFDLILTNPPYVVEDKFPDFPDEYHFEPKMAFVAGEQGLDIILPILANANEYLTDQGLFVMEAGTAAPLLQERFKDIPFTWLMSDSGESVVLLMTKQEFNQYQSRFSEENDKL